MFRYKFNIFGAIFKIKKSSVEKTKTCGYNNIFSFIKKQQKQYKRYFFFQITKDNRLVFDVFQPPLHSKCFEDYAEYFSYNGERCFMEASNDPASLSLLCSGKGGPTRYFCNKAKYVSILQPFYQQITDMDPTLIFESRFESGNLRRAIQVGDFEYDLILKMDFAKLNGLAQWFYFNISNTRSNCTYRFNIINMTMIIFGVIPSKECIFIKGFIGWGWGKYLDLYIF